MFESDEEREAECRRICESGEVKRGREGHELWAQFGEVRHVYAFLMRDGSRLRLIGPRQSPALFSPLRGKYGIEKAVKA